MAGFIPRSLPVDPAVLSSIPAMQPPPGAVVDFNAPNPWQKISVSVTSVFIALALVSVGVRAYTKTRIVGKGSWDDCKTLRAYISEVADG